jgi:polyhydroxyalkanoate synthase
VRFVLAASGHIAGVVNPPAAHKYCHWTNDSLPASPDAWFAGAAQQDGSWWPDWQAWVAASDGTTVPARHPGDRELKVIEPAPGSYVLVKAGA